MIHYCMEDEIIEYVFSIHLIESKLYENKDK